MIVVDPSALMAIIEAEDDSDTLFACLSAADQAVMAAPSKLELMMVASKRKHGDGVSIARGLVEDIGIQIVDWTDELANIATDAFLQYGKGQHPARLNFGDCMAYALAKSLDAPLLFKGNDFSLTDIRPAA